MNSDLETTLLNDSVQTIKAEIDLSVISSLATHSSNILYFGRKSADVSQTDLASSGTLIFFLTPNDFAELIRAF